MEYIHQTTNQIINILLNTRVSNTPKKVKILKIPPVIVIISRLKGNIVNIRIQIGVNSHRWVLNLRVIMDQIGRQLIQQRILASSIITKEVYSHQELELDRRYLITAMTKWKNKIASNHHRLFQKELLLTMMSASVKSVRTCKNWLLSRQGMAVQTALRNRSICTISKSLK